MKEQIRRILIVSNVPVDYRVDFFNLLKRHKKYDTNFCFIPERGIDYKNSICVFTDENFLEGATFYKNNNKVIRLIMFLLDIIKSRPSVIVNSGMSPTIIILCFYKIIFRKKLIVWWAGTSLSEKGVRTAKFLYRKIISKFVDGAIFYSPLALDYYKELRPVMVKNVIIGNNTRDSKRYAQKVFSCNVKKSCNKIVFLTVGFQTAQKNTIAILEAFIALNKYKDKISLVVAGDGPELSKLKLFCQNNQLDNVEFVGHIAPNDLVEIYAKADVYIHPSLIDRWPQTYNEAAAAGLPILLSSTSGVSNKYTNKFEEFVIFDPNNYVEIAIKIKMVVEDKKLRENLGKNAFKLAMKYDCKYAASMFIDLIDDISNYK